MDATQQFALASAAAAGVLLGALASGYFARRRLARAAGLVAARLEGGDDVDDAPPELAPLLAAHARLLQRMRQLQRESEAQNRQLSADMLAQMRQADGAIRAKERFLAASGHDLRQPLQALELHLAQLRRNATAAQLDDIDGMQAGMRAMAEILDGLLLLSQLDTLGIEPAPAVLPVQELFDELGSAHLPNALRAGAELRTHGGALAVHADPGLLAGLLGRLIDNALNATARGGRVLVAARRRGDRVRIEVRDNGIGIAPVNQPRLFDEFFQVGNAERDHRKGLGLGLAIASRMATLLGTRIELRSRLRAGSCFWLDLPRAEPGQQAAQVLLLGRDDEQRRDTAAMLRGWGYRSVEIDGEREPRLAWKQQAAGSPGAIILWPDEIDDPAWLLFARLAERHPQAARAVVTRDASPAMLELARMHRAQLLLVPVSPAKLRALLGQRLPQLRGAA